MAPTPLSMLGALKQNALELADDPVALLNYLRQHVPLMVGPTIADFSPAAGWPGSMVEIIGTNFSLVPSENQVTIGGDPAIVVEASVDRLVVIAGPLTISGLVTVTVGTNTATSTNPFVILPYPDASIGEDGPPMSFAGTGMPVPGDQPSTGTLRILVVLLNPTDVVPASPAVARQNVIDLWDQVRTFYNQASYNRLTVQVDVTANWHTLLGNRATYIDPSINNVFKGLTNRVAAEAAQAAVDEGFNLDNYGIMCCVIFLNGQFIRAWGGWALQNFTFDDTATSTHINITTTNEINLIEIQESAQWGRFAHETGHNLVAAPNFTASGDAAATLGEDVYTSDLVDPSAATAHRFEMMGDHDAGPCFSAYHLDKLGWYSSANIVDLQWDRNPFSKEYDLIAHGLTEDTSSTRYHLLRLRVVNGLYYYVEVRQRPGATSQVFDASIPLDGAANEGGVVVHKVISDTVNNNQQMRFLSLLHDAHVLKQGDLATDPVRDLKVTVVNDHVQARPLVCRVRIEWAQNLTADPNGKFDLRLDSWDSNYQTPDIWIDRAPFGTFDQGKDSEGRPKGNGDRPKVKEINHLTGRVHNDGTDAASNVRVTYYAITPGVGDNGNWAPLQTKVAGTISGGGFADVEINWVPVLGKHTCLRVFAEKQLGEISYGTNLAQENVVDFQAASSSPAEPVVMPVTVRNPHLEERLILLRVRNVPFGFHVHFPHAWVILPGLGEKELQLTIVPTEDYAYYEETYTTIVNDRPVHIKPHAQIGVVGGIIRDYAELLAGALPPGSRMSPIGGVSARVTVMRRVEIRLAQNFEAPDGTVKLDGGIIPELADQSIRVDLADPTGVTWIRTTKTDRTGRFEVLFDFEDPPAFEPESSPRLVSSPYYKAQAFTVDADVAADTASNVIIVNP